MSTENEQDSLLSQYMTVVWLQTAGALYNRKDSIDNRSLRAEIEQVGSAILKEISRLPADQRQWVTALFIHQKELGEIVEAYGIRVEDCLRSLSPFWLSDSKRFYGNLEKNKRNREKEIPIA